jgi:hypothetical protein
VQEPTLTATADKKLLAVGRNGITALYSKGQDAEDIPLNAKYSAGSRKRKLKAGWIHQGDIDTRRAHLIADAHRTSLKDSMQHIIDAMQTPEAGRQPHWLLTAILQKGQNAENIIGTHPTNTDPSFTTAGPDPESATAEGATVIWITTGNNLGVQHLKEMEAKNRNAIYAIHGNKHDQPMMNWLEKHTRLAGHVPQGCQALQRKDAHSKATLSPVASNKKITLRYTGDLDVQALKRELRKPFWAEPFKALQASTGARWERFHSLDQAAPYMHVAGVVAATDGSS